jgi:hypothetical protein
MNPAPARDARHARPDLTPHEVAIARSVLYASLFDYPLTLAQLRTALIGSVQTPSEILEVYGRSDRLRAVIDYADGFFVPRGRQDLIGVRARREDLSRAFLDGHRPLLACICAIPFVRMVALSGSIAHLNLDGDGDLDLFIVTRGRRVWSVTVAVVLLAKMFGRRRTVCANFVIADSRLTLDQHDLFTASQIIHLRPLVGHDVFRAFLAANPFVARFFPNADAEGPGLPADGMARPVAIVKRLVEWVTAVPSHAAERLCRLAYGAYLRRQARTWQSPEQVRLEADCLKLHTRSHRRSILERFEQVVHDALGGCGEAL